MQYRLVATILAAATLDVALAHPSAHAGHKHIHARDAYQYEKEPNWEDKNLYKDVNWDNVFGRKPAGGQEQPSQPQQQSPPSYDKPAPAAPKPEQSKPYKPAEKPSKPAGEYHAPKPNKHNKIPAKPTTPKKPSGSGGKKTGPGGGGWGTCKGTEMRHGATEYEMYGNTGGKPGTDSCGCNVQLVGAGDKTAYPYTNCFTSKASKPRVIEIWNTVGCSSGQPLSGKGEAPAKRFTLQPGESQTVAFQAGSKVNWCDYTEGGKNGDDGSRKCVYGEAEFGNTLKDGWSAYDVSHLRNGGGKCGMSIKANGHPVSSCSENCYNLGEEAVTNIAPVLGPGPMRLDTVISDPH